MNLKQAFKKPVHIQDKASEVKVEDSYSNADYIRKFKSLSYIQQKDIIKQFGIANIVDSRLKSIYNALRACMKKVNDSKIIDEDAGPKQGLTADQWPAEVEDPNTGEMKPIGKKADSKKAN